MKVLLLAPHPFYQERGTPIAVDLLIRELSAQGHEIDLLTFNEGENRLYSNVNIVRVEPWLPVKGVKPGFSLKKIYLDFWLFVKAWGMIRSKSYDVVHAVEETGFMALCFHRFFKVPFVLDMDSLLTTQIIDKFQWLKPFESVFRRLESMPVKSAVAVVPVCQAIADEVKKYRQQGVYLLKDVSLAAPETTESVESVRDYFTNFTNSGDIVMYIGNLESYQGIDLLLESFALVVESHKSVCLAIIGGNDRDLGKYSSLIKKKGLSDRVKLLGRKPVTAITNYMLQADVLVSPRIQGENTPMKVYSYLDSGRAVVATNLPTHTQVMNSDIAFLAEPEPEMFSNAILDVLKNKDLREKVALNAKRFIAREHSMAAFRQRLKTIYRFVGEERHA